MENMKELHEYPSCSDIQRFVLCSHVSNVDGVRNAILVVLEKVINETFAQTVWLFEIAPMSDRKKFVQSPKGQINKISSKGLKNVFNALGRRFFSKVYKNEVEYGQTLSKKRRKNCVLKSVTSLACPGDDNEHLMHSPYHINFQFTKEDAHFRSSVVNFQKIDFGESCCDKCFCTLQKGDSFSRFSISSDSACDVSSESSCDDLECAYRRRVSKPVKRVRKKTSDTSKTVERTLKNFIRIHTENFKNETSNPVYDISDAQENSEDTFLRWAKEENRNEPLADKAEEPDVNEPGYDILVSKSNCMVVEPSYENLKLIQTFYEDPQAGATAQSAPEEKLGEKNREMMQSSKTYDEVIESLKHWHLNLKYPNCYCCIENVENEMNHYAEGYESLENDFNNDIEEFCC